MRKSHFVKPLLAAAFAVSAVMPFSSTSAAIPCGTLPMIEPEPNMPVPMIYIELPVSLEGALARSQSADREASVPASDQADSVISAAQNQFRCIGYEDSVAFATNSTPQQRVNMWAVPAVDDSVNYIAIESFHLVQLGEPMQLADGRLLVDFSGIVDGKQYLVGELIFVDHEGQLYLDGSAIHEAVELNAEPIMVPLTLITTREVKLVPVTQGDVVVFDNKEEESSADVVITDANGETIFDGFAMATTMTGGENNNIFVINNLEPGEYVATITFDQDDITYTVTLIVHEGADATPVASPVN